MMTTTITLCQKKLMGLLVMYVGMHVQLIEEIEGQLSIFATIL